MKRITEYKKLFGVEKEIELKALKTSYRNLVKEWHPDKFQEGDEMREKAETHSRKIIDAYHFLVSIAPETRAAHFEEYSATINNSEISDYHHEGMILEIFYSDGNTYEFFGVSKQIYRKMVNSNKVNRFAKRSIYPNYIYRKANRSVVEA